MHDREIVLIAALAGLIWLTLACARAASKADQVTEAGAPFDPEIRDFELWSEELYPQRPVYDWKEMGL